MYILRVVIFSLDEPNLTRILTVFKENLVKYKGTSQDIVFIVFHPLCRIFTQTAAFLLIESQNLTLNCGLKNKT